MAEQDDKFVVALHRVRERETLRVLDAALQTADGKRLVYTFLELCGVFRNPFAGESTHQTAFNAGSSNVGKMLIHKLDTIDPTAFPRLMLDMANIRASDDAEARAQADRARNQDGD